MLNTIKIRKNENVNNAKICHFFVQIHQKISPFLLTFLLECDIITIEKYEHHFLGGVFLGNSNYCR